VSCHFVSTGYTNNSLEYSVVKTEHNNSVGFEVLMAASMKMAIFWVAGPCSLVEVYLRFRGTSCLHHQGSEKVSESDLLIALMMEAASTSEMLVNFYQTTQHYNPEGSHLHSNFVFTNKTYTGKKPSVATWGESWVVTWGQQCKWRHSKFNGYCK
jgi:hypothetical protein